MVAFVCQLTLVCSFNFFYINKLIKLSLKMFRCEKIPASAVNHFQSNLIFFLNFVWKISLVILNYLSKTIQTIAGPNSIYYQKFRLELFFLLNSWIAEESLPSSPETFEIIWPLQRIMVQTDSVNLIKPI